MASLKNRKIVLKVGEQYDYPIQGDSVRVTAANVPIYFKTADGNLDFYLLAGEKADFTGQDFLTLIIYHLDAADQTVVLSFGHNANIGSATVSGSVTISNAVALDAPTLAALESVDLNAATRDLLRFESYGSSYKSTTALAANTPDTVFTAAANTNGAILHYASALSYNASGGVNAFIAKATAPTSIIDGDVIANPCMVQGGVSVINMTRAIKIPAGKGLYFIYNLAESGTSLENRSALYTLL